MLFRVWFQVTPECSPKYGTIYDERIDKLFYGQILK